MKTIIKKYFSPKVISFILAITSLWSISFPMYMTLLFLKQKTLIPPPINYNINIITLTLFPGYLCFLIMIITIIYIIIKRIKINWIIILLCVFSLLTVSYFSFFDSFKIIETILD